ncbi:MAG TPA: ATP-binding protein [Anaerolineae bacterium]
MIRIVLADMSIVGRHWLIVCDDGCGFDLPRNLDTFARSHHFGLFNAREQLAAVGGQLSVRSAPGKGTEIRVWGQVGQANGS